MQKKRVNKLEDRVDKTIMNVRWRYRKRIREETVAGLYVHLTGVPKGKER